jgi:hypothetical protein
MRLQLSRGLGSARVSTKLEACRATDGSYCSRPFHFHVYMRYDCRGSNSLRLEECENEAGTAGILLPYPSLPPSPSLLLQRRGEDRWKALNLYVLDDRQADIKIMLFRYDFLYVTLEKGYQDKDFISIDLSYH